MTARCITSSLPLRHALLAFATVIALSATSLLLAPSAYAVGERPTPGWVTDGVVKTAVESNGILYIGGSFNRVAPRSGGGDIVNIIAMGHFSQGTSSATKPGDITPQLDEIHGTVYASVGDAEGGWYIAGDFSGVGESARANVAHVFANGVLDPRFDPGTDGPVYALAISGSTLYLGGDFAAVDGTQRTRLAAVDRISGVVRGFDPQADGTVRTLLVSGTTLYAGGSFSTIGGRSRQRLAALDLTRTSGNALTSFNAAVTGTSVHALTMNAGTLYVGGSFTNIGGAARGNIAALNPGTGTATAWNPNANGAVRALLVSGTNMMAGGTFTTIGGASRTNLASIQLGTNTNNNNTGFNATLNGSGVYALSIGYLGIEVGGSFTSLGGAEVHNVGQISPSTGVNHAGYNVNTNGSVYTIAATSIGFVFVGGAFSGTFGAARDNAAAIDLRTGDATSFDPGPNGEVRALVVSGGTVYLGGAFTTAGGGSRAGLAAVDAASGALISGFAQASGGTPQVNSLNLTGGTLYAGGSFNALGGASRSNLAAVSPSTGTATSWNPGADGAVNTLEASGTTLYVGGAFANAGGSPRLRIAALNTTVATNNALGWNPGADGPVTALEHDPGSGTLYVGGAFSTIGAVGRANVAAVGDASGGGGTLPWNPGANGAVNALFRDAASGLVYAGGSFTTIGGQSRGRLAELDSSGTATAWNPALDADVYVVQRTAGWLHAGGAFTSGKAAFRGVASFPSTAPSITGTPTLSLVKGIANITWQTDMSATSEVQFGPASGYFRYRVRAARMTSGWHGVMLRDLAPGTYYYKVVSSNGFVATTSESSFVVPYDASVPFTTWTLNREAFHGMEYNDKIYLGGRFTRIGPRSGRLRLIDPNKPHASDLFAPEVNGQIWDIVSDGQSGWYIAGNFTYVGGVAHDRLAHVLPDGGVDPMFVPAVDGDVHELLLSGSTLYVGGTFTTIDGASRNNIGAVDAGTGAVTSWNPGADDLVDSFAVSGTTLYAGGMFTTIGGAARSSLAALDTTVAAGTASSWNPNVTGTSPTVKSLLLSGTTLYVGGTFTKVGSAPRNNLAAVSTSGTTNVQTTWNPNVDDTVNALLLSGTTLYVGGHFATIGSGGGAVTRHLLAAVSTATGTATAWDPNIDGGWEVRDMTLYGTLMFAVGDFYSVGTLGRNHLAQFDTTVNTNNITGYWFDQHRPVQAISQSGSSIAIGGEFSGGGGPARGRIASVDENDGAPSNWNPNADGNVFSMTAANGAIYATGEFGGMDGVVRPRLIKLDPDATAAGTHVITGFNANMVGTNTTSVQASADGSTLYAGGNFTNAGGQTRSNIAALNATTGTATAWNPGANGTVHGNGLALSGTTLYAAGEFTTIGGKARPLVAALDTTVNTNSALAAFNANAVGARAYSTHLSGGALYVGGEFTNMGGAARSNIAALDPTTGLARSWNPGASNAVWDARSFGSTIFTGGDFVSIGGAVRAYAAGLDAAVDTNQATAFDPKLSGNDVITLDSTSHVNQVLPVGTSVYLLGSFTAVGPRGIIGFAGFGDTTPPAAPATVYDGAVVGVDAAFTGSLTDIVANWTTVSDPQGSGLGRYDTCVSTSATGSDCGAGAVAPWMPYDALTIATRDSLALVDNQLYYFCVRARDMSGNNGPATCSDGQRVDATAPPAVSAVADGAGADIDLTNLTSTTVSANWTGTVDVNAPQSSGVARYEHCVTTSSSGADCSNSLVPWTSTALATSATTPSVTLTDGATYYSCVRVLDVVGNVSITTCSDGMTVDATPPQTATLVSPPDVSNVGGPPTLTATYTDPAPGTAGLLHFRIASNAACTTVVDSGSTAAGIASGQNGSWTPTSLANGTYWWCARGEDAAGNLSTSWSTPWQMVVGAVSITVGVDSATLTINPNPLVAGDDGTAVSVVSIDTNSTTGYSLLASDTSDSACMASGPDTVPDFSAGLAAPATWAAGTSGYCGMTVLDATGGRLAKWGAGTTTVTDFTNNRYAGPTTALDTVHSRASYATTTDTVTVGYRINVSSGQALGVYSQTLTYTATVNP